jgi:hypothetical protein
MSARSWSLHLLGAAALVLGLSGCGGGSGGGTAATSAGGGAAAGNDVQAFCAVVKRQAAMMQSTELSSLLTGGSPAAWKAYFDKIDAMNQQLVDAAPADIKSAVSTLRASSQQMKATLSAAGYDVTKVGSSTMLKTIQSKDRVDASKALSTYVQTNCGVDLSQPAS